MFELKYFTNNGREKIHTGFKSLQELIDFYFKKRKNLPGAQPGANWGQWRKVEFKEFGKHKYKFNPNRWKLI